MAALPARPRTRLIAGCAGGAGARDGQPAPPTSLPQSPRPVPPPVIPYGLTTSRPELVRLVAEPWPANVDSRGVIQQV
jgi:hypothetical protein